MSKEITVKHYKNKIFYNYNSNNNLLIKTKVNTNQSKAIISPGFIDLQVNGNNGINFTSPDHINKKNVISIVDYHLKNGVFYFLPTITTNSNKNIKSSFSKLNKLRNLSKKIKKHIPCYHLEGPYISNEDGPRGAHQKKYIRNPSWEEFLGFQETAEGLIKIVTLAPELKGSIKFISKLRDNLIIPAIGHTNANTKQISESIEAGALLSTHIGNGAHEYIKRHPNYIWDQLSEDGLWSSLIADGFHLSPNTLKVLIRAKGIKQCVLVSDASYLRGMNAGNYTDFGKNILIEKNGKIKINNTNYLAGSNLNLIDGIFNTYNFSNVKLYQSIEMASFNPKKFLKKYANISLNIFDKNHYLIIDPSKNSILHSIYL